VQAVGDGVGDPFAVGPVVGAQLKVAATRMARPMSCSKRRRRARASKGPAPNSANPAIGRTLATMAPAMNVSTRLPVLGGGNAPVTAQADCVGDELGVGSDDGLELALGLGWVTGEGGGLGEGLGDGFGDGFGDGLGDGDGGGGGWVMVYPTLFCPFINRLPLAGSMTWTMILCPPTEFVFAGAVRTGPVSHGLAPAARRLLPMP
jgi:hypothetical protein